MLFIIGLSLSILFLDWPWQLVVAVPLALVEVLEISLWLRMRDLPDRSGPSALVGQSAEVVEDCEPTGLVKVAGQIWTATASSSARRHTRVVVTGVDGIRLQVSPQSGSR
jgi:membrane protein implicated in regulation of membrane protease activity